MRKIVYFTLAAATLWLSGCTGLRMTSSEEVDDVYATSADRNTPANHTSSKEQAPSTNADKYSAADSRTSEDYDRARESKYADDPNYVSDNNSRYGNGGDYNYGDDDYYYSRRVRRFNTRGFNYYDPYFSYDPYYALGTPTWSSYRNTPWWYDPYYYSGPSYSWTCSWGAPGYAFYPSQYAWNR
ncbi:MAG TPA: hypothetical protein ENJ82_15180, partial [Bacteroidetes bacterium]|nr:hypothetical protein [Bacteroidota bacterium]